MLSSDRIHRLGGFLLRVVLAGALGMVLTLEFAAAVRRDEHAAVALILPGLVAIALVLFADGHLPQWSIPVAVLSLSGSAWGFVFAPSRVASFAEAGALLVLLAWTIRGWRLRYGRAAIVLLLGAVLAVPLRGGSLRALVLTDFLVSPVVTAAVAFGIYLYNVDVRRRRALAQVRRGERLELARELHDFVAHHVTGIVVRAQAAQYIPESETVAARDAFAAIEHAGAEALTSMRRLVAVMREAESDGGIVARGDLRQTVDLVERFSGEGVPATIHIAPEPDAGLPPEVSGSIHRIVRESLTNVRKHAHGATQVTVAVTPADDAVEVTVRDDGRPSRSSGAGGFGLAGLSERVAMVGGELSAGPAADTGWEVHARLPLPSGQADEEMT